MIMDFFRIKRRRKILIGFGVFLAVVLSYLSIVNKNLIWNHFEVKYISKDLEREDWDIYPLGCYLIQIPSDYMMVTDYAQIRAPAYIIRRPEQVGDWVEIVRSASGLEFTMAFIDDGIPDEVFKLIYDLEDTRHVDIRKGGVRYRYYYYDIKNVQNKHNPKRIAGVLITPSIPKDGKLSLYIEAFHSNDEELLAEIASTFRIDQRHFGIMTMEKDKPHPLDLIDPEYGAYVHSHFSVEEFRSLEGGMVQTPYMRSEMRPCDLPKIGEPAPSDYYIHNILEGR